MRRPQLPSPAWTVRAVITELIGAVSLPGAFLELYAIITPFIWLLLRLQLLWICVFEAFFLLKRNNCVVMLLATLVCALLSCNSG